ncbi:hypothetical protein EV586_10263 [Tumebacillus sp. BK434]|uniref:hypothetical protein n=1 Tax=Tumebacillus sp. BK434 TaxID=2512169 RepID=UPI001051464E|nr:hypothetical protein [Tumebacillus sp. BK434]TCP57619.1 hypothetical protein EV586_10263 [Tumebacillus sp. BK434]
MSSIFLIIFLLFYLATWGWDMPKLKQATGIEKGIYYTLAVSVLGLYVARLFQFELELPTHWVVYTWSDWLHEILQQ